MAEIVALREAVAELVHDGDTIALEGFTHLIPFAAGHEIIRQQLRHLTGDTIALEGFTHLIPFAAGHEIIRQQLRHLTLVRLTPDIVFDQMIGMGLADRLIFSWGGNPGVGSLHRFRDAIERGWPHPLAIEEHSHAGMTNRFVAGASGLPFAVLRGYVDSDLLGRADTLAPITCPFTGEQLTAVAALNPDVTIIHAQQADRSGNVALWGITGVQKKALLAARRSIVTVEEVVDSFSPGVNPVLLPGWTVSAVCVVPGGAHPSYALGYSSRDNEFYRAWDLISRDRDVFLAWMDQHVLDVSRGHERPRARGAGGQADTSSQTQEVNRGHLDSERV